ncbi:MAG: hypothetical protein PGN16_15065 [Sphingomonas phyllosphaerae]
MLGALVKELAALPRSDREAILAALDESERERVRAALRDDLPEPAGPHSVWMTALIAAADRAEDGMTAAARAALLAATGRVAQGERTAGRSLLQAAGSAFAAGHGR